MTKVLITGAVGLIGQAQIGGLQIADTCFYYPEDRGVSEGIRLGREMADAV